MRLYCLCPFLHLSPFLSVFSALSLFLSLSLSLSLSLYTSNATFSFPFLTCFLLSLFLFSSLFFRCVALSFFLSPSQYTYFSIHYFTVALLYWPVHVVHPSPSFSHCASICIMIGCCSLLKPVYY